VSKAYLAVVAGRLGTPEGPPILVDAPLEGRAASTEVRPLLHTRCLRYGGWVTTARLVPLTGRRHQLRRHLAVCLGHPILGDPLYTRWAPASDGGGGGGGGGAAAARDGTAAAAAAAALLAATPDELRARAAAEDAARAEGLLAGGGGGPGGAAAAGGGPELLRGWGMALWAAELELAHPSTGERLRWALPEPPRFAKLRAQQAARWGKFCGAGAGAAAAATDAG
jgi:hypothetical protein